MIKNVAKIEQFKFNNNLHGAGYTTFKLDFFRYKCYNFDNTRKWFEEQVKKLNLHLKPEKGLGLLYDSGTSEAIICKKIENKVCDSFDDTPAKKISYTWQETKRVKDGDYIIYIPDYELYKLLMLTSKYQDSIVGNLDVADCFAICSKDSIEDLFSSFDIDVSDKDLFLGD